MSARLAASADDADALARLPSDVLIRRGEAVERRRDVARPDRAHISLSDAVSAALDRLVRAPPASVVPEALLRRDVRDRAGGALSDRRPAEAAPLRRRRADRAA